MWLERGVGTLNIRKINVKITQQPLKFPESNASWAIRADVSGRTTKSNAS